MTLYQICEPGRSHHENHENYDPGRLHHQLRTPAADEAKRNKLLHNQVCHPGRSHRTLTADEAKGNNNKRYIIIYVLIQDFHIMS